MAIEILHFQTLPKEMRTPPYGANITVHEDHTVVDLCYVHGGPIYVMPGETLKIGLQYDAENNIVLCVTRERTPDAPAKT